MASGVVGVIFICLGLTMHVLQKTPGISDSPVISTLKPKSDPGERPSEKSLTGSQIPKQEPISGPQSTQKQEALSSSIQTIYEGVVASVVRFEKSGGLVVLQLMARNTSRQVRMVCFQPQRTNLVHEATGESWQPKDFVGQECTPLEGNTSSRVWMKFDIATPEKRTYSLSSPLLRGTLDNLVLAESS
jgi:hypothetical protein